MRTTTAGSTVVGLGFCVLGPHIDVYECLPCGERFVTTADHLTFSKPPPLECESCEAGMSARRYVVAS